MKKVKSILGGKEQNRRIESTVYAVLWLTVMVLYLLSIVRGRAQTSDTLFDMNVLKRFFSNILPFFILFIINNNILIPRLLLRNKVAKYFICSMITIALLWVYQYLQFMHEMPMHHPGEPGHPMHQPQWRPLIPLPLFLDFTYAFLVVGCNMAIALLFQRFDDKLENESLMKANAESQLAYLKAQINPHFYMNMLNNIHGMIEIDPSKAQSMLIDMSQLMRYMLYESSKPLISLSSEVNFLRNYLRLIRQRFPEKRVRITVDFPKEEECQNISIPPLLYLVFIENAFKHGISYRETSYVDISLSIEDSEIHFSCKNSNHATPDKDPEHEGIGLINIKKRLSLLFGEKSVLNIEDTAKEYAVNLTIPTHEIENNNN
jgi:hypothetical protein